MRSLHEGTVPVSRHPPVGLAGSGLRRRSLRFAAALGFSLQFVVPGALQASGAVLLVGDSWARQMFDDGALAGVIAGHGLAEVAVRGDATTEDGTTAAEWAAAPRLALLDAELAAHPEIEVVVIFLGGNDFLEGMSGGGWYVGIPPADESALFDAIEGDLATIVDHLLGLDSGLRVVLSSYDYPNFVETLNTPGAFVCAPLWNDLGQPTPAEINGATALLDARFAALAAARPRLSFVSHWGLMQYLFGYSSLGIAPGELPPPGDPTLPSPPAAMRTFGWDCFHLKASGYAGLAERLWDRALEWPLLGGFEDDFESGDPLAWSAEAGWTP